jgi:hypothetical protein
MDKALTITCPHCKRSFALDEGILQPIRADIRTSVEADYEARTKQAVDLARAQAEQQSKVQVEQQTAALKKQVEDAAAAAQLARQNEKAALEAQSRLKQEKDELDLQYMRKYQADLEKVRSEVTARQDLVVKAKEQTIEGLKKQIEELQKKAELGSQQAQGEALEATIKERLERAFPGDAIEDVPTGTRGADVVQKVNSRFGRCCGTIIWESKQTKAWVGDWVAKLKKNQREAGAEVAVIASTALPEGVDGFKEMDGIWVTSWPLAIQLASALRYALVELDRSKVAVQGQSQKMEMLYGYLVSPQFRQRIQDIVEAFSELDDEITKEKRAMERIWARREKLIERVKNGTTRMYGELEGIMGSEIPALPALEMPYTLGEGTEADDEVSLK